MMQYIFGYLMSSRFDEGFHAISWRYLSRVIFDKRKLIAWINALKAERVKGVLVTDEGVVGINAIQNHREIETLGTCAESRLEIIASIIDPAWEVGLNDCVKNNMDMGKIGQLFAV